MEREIVLAIDPALRKIEEVLLWKNKLKTCAIFTFCHFLFWIFQNFNIRTYCIISSVCLALHILDAYRTKKRREIYRLQQTKPNIIENISSLGRYIIIVCDYTRLFRNKLAKLKQRNRLQYFLVLLLFWSVTAVVGVKIRGVYLVYLSFWMIFFVPPVLYYDVPRKMLGKALPLLEQLDQSMKYQRRSLLDKNELLVDVKLPQTDLIDEEIENEYLQSFKLTDLNQLKEKDRKVIENLQDDEDDDEDDEDAQQHLNYKNLDSESETPSLKQDAEEEEESSDEMYAQRIQHQLNRREAQRTSTANAKKPSTARTNLTYDAETDDDGLNSFLPDDSLPNISDVVNDYYPSSSSRRAQADAAAEDEEAYRRYGNLAPSSGADRVLRKRVKNRPSLLDYYGSSSGGQQRTSGRRLNENDIDETFDFLDEYNDK